MTSTTDLTREANRLLYAVILVLLALTFSQFLRHRPADSRQQITLEPCPTEDSVNCYWLAEIHGNGIGRSFINIDGQIYYRKDI